MGGANLLSNMASSYVDTSFSTIFTADSADTTRIQDAIIALQTALTTEIPTPSGFSLSGASWVPQGPVGSPTSGIFVLQWSPTA